MKITKMHFGAFAFTFEKAKELRLKMTDAETILWSVLSDKDEFPWKFRNQHPANKFILDFYCHKVKLAIEVDGEYHNSKVNQFYDDDRDRILEEFGIKTLRFTNNEVQFQLSEVKSRIKKVITHRLIEDKEDSISSARTKE